METAVESRIQSNLYGTSDFYMVHKDIRQFLNAHYPQWIVLGGTIAWPPRSPDLTLLDFYFWGYMKQKVYAVVIESREQLLDRIDIAAEEIRQNYLEIQRTTQCFI
ncbi:hypothetical protein QTP88_026754 [Uroleucon formosanum]